MSKEIDRTCQLCLNYDSCTKESSQGCENYEFYKCVNCADRTMENDNVPRCFRGGTPCKEVRYCSKDRAKRGNVKIHK